MTPLEDRAYHSRFGGLWIDRWDAELEVERRLVRGSLNDDMATRIRFFVRNGYVVIKNAVDDATIEKLMADFSSVKTLPKKFIAGSNLSYQYADDYVDDPSFRLIDPHVNWPSALDAMFSKKISAFLTAIFEEPPLAFQTLGFTYGSQQEIHQDTAYVVVSQPLKMAASWIALEDVTEGTGELIYYQGSHRNADFTFSGKYKHFSSDRDGRAAHDNFIQHLHNQAALWNQPLRSFLPKRGDALIWAADLAHGGQRISTAKKTRKSLVTHYCPRSVTPSYFSYSPYRTRLSAPNGGLYSSSYYDLSQPGLPRTPVRVNGSYKNRIWTMSQRVRHQILPLNGSVMTMDRDQMTISHDNDPAFEIKLDTAHVTSVLQVNAQVLSLEPSRFQIFYPNQSGNFDESHSTSVPINAGENEIQIRCVLTDPTTKIRIDPGNSGELLIRTLTIDSVI